MKKVERICRACCKKHGVNGDFTKAWRKDKTTHCYLHENDFVFTVDCYSDEVWEGCWFKLETLLAQEKKR